MKPGQCRWLQLQFLWVYGPHPGHGAFRGGNGSCRKAHFCSLKFLLLPEALQVSFIDSIQKEACQYLDPYCDIPKSREYPYVRTERLPGHQFAKMRPWSISLNLPLLVVIPSQKHCFSSFSLFIFSPLNFGYPSLLGKVNEFQWALVSSCIKWG